MGRAARDSPSSAGRGARLRAAAARVRGRAPGPPAPGRGAPPPQARAQLAAAPARSPARLEGALHYSLFTSVNRLEARRVGGEGAVGAAASGEGVGREGAGRRRGCGGGRGQEVPAWAPAFRAHLRPPPARRRVRGLRRAPGGKCGPLTVPLGLCPPRPRPVRAAGRGLRAVRPALRAPRVPDAARASFIIIFGQVECAWNSCCARLTSEGGSSGNRGMDDGGRGGQSPRGPGAGRREARSVQLRLVASAAPLPVSPGAGRGGGRPGRGRARRDTPRGRRTGGRAAGGARGRRDLAGVSGLGCGGGGAAALVALSGLAQRPGGGRGRAGCGDTNRRWNCTCPRGRPAVFSRGRGRSAFVLHGRDICRAGRRGRKRPTPRGAPAPARHRVNLSRRGARPAAPAAGRASPPGPLRPGCGGASRGGARRPCPAFGGRVVSIGAERVNGSRRPSLSDLGPASSQ